MIEYPLWMIRTAHDPRLRCLLGGDDLLRVERWEYPRGEELRVMSPSVGRRKDQLLFGKTSASRGSTRRVRDSDVERVGGSSWTQL